MQRILLGGFLVLAGLVFCTSSTSAADGWQAGAAKVKITPRQPMWMSGYAARTRPAEGTLTELWAKALVLEDADGQRAVLVTLDLIGLDRDFSNAIRDELEEKYDLRRRQVALASSHTHTGPVVGANLTAMYFLDEEGQRRVHEYSAQLQGMLVAVVGEAINNLAPADVAWGVGQATFAVNRRNNREADVERLRAEDKLVGPVDHDLPVLTVREADGALRAVVCGYACHATTLDDYRWSGDYAGFAQLKLEESHPGALALFWAGCGADQNPLPRRSVELARHYGEELAAAVSEVVAGQMTPLTGALSTSYEEIDLPFAELPTREELARNAESDNRYEARRATLLLAQIDAGRPLSPTYPYPVQVWRLGPELQWVILGGEVVVDYALRIKEELGPQHTWAAGYANDVMAYIASRRVLAEGGYEGGGSMVYYGLPTVWSPAIEEMILDSVHRQVNSLPGGGN